MSVAVGPVWPDRVVVGISLPIRARSITQALGSTGSHTMVGTVIHLPAWNDRKSIRASRMLPSSSVNGEPSRRVRVVWYSFPASVVRLELASIRSMLQSPALSFRIALLNKMPRIVKYPRSSSGAHSCEWGKWRSGRSISVIRAAGIAVAVDPPIQPLMWQL